MTRHTSYVVEVRKLRGGEPSGPMLTYCYGSPLRVGDRVMCPGNEFSGPFIAEVTELGSDYDGHIRVLLCRVAPDRRRP